MLKIINNKSTIFSDLSLLYLYFFLLTVFIVLISKFQCILLKVVQRLMLDKLPNPHGFYSLSLKSTLGGPNTTSILQELVKKKNEDMKEYARIQEALKTISNTKKLDDMLPDKSQNASMKKVMSFYETFFDEESGNTKEEGLEQLESYLKEELNSYIGIMQKTNKDIKNLTPGENTKSGDSSIPEENSSSSNFKILPIITPFSVFNVLPFIRVFLNIFSICITCIFIAGFKINSFIPQMCDFEIPALVVSIVWCLFELFRLQSKVRKYYKLGKLTCIFIEKFVNYIKKITKF